MAAPLMERQIGDCKPFAQAAMSGFKSIETGLLVVTDCASDAWDESDKQALTDLRNAFGDDLVDAYESDLRRAGHWLIEGHLRAEWRNRDFLVTFAKSAHSGADGVTYNVPADEVYHQVWQAAADAITAKDLVLEAALGHIFALGTELERLRAAVSFRLNEWASDDMSDRAEQQLEGLRAAVENAKTCAQLIAIGESFA
ncbi:hypothetical protein GCM10017774_77100 [Lentzea cavernae]|uniref:Uncharacterized protein n=2 Tax=Lentzea cavernae TaxID=2020703 RepID=A0ABQ3MTS8_9PSEU|nr:hypothetical protein GCM10017774_77100 [Lentzea cavernae]